MGTDTERIRQIEQLIENANQLKHTLGSDPHRPRYHFMPAAALINDINGSIFWKGRYHLFTNRTLPVLTTTRSSGATPPA